MKRAAFLVLSAVVGLAGATGAASAPKAKPLCVDQRPNCYPTIQAALAAAHDGDTIQIRPGTYQGGVTIDASVSLVGAGAGATVISGGGPVLTIGDFGADTEPTVSIEGVTVTSGVTNSSPESTDFVGADDVIALGGGIEISPASNYSTGATVTIKNSVITANSVAPTQTVPVGPPCPGGPCPFAWAKGGGIDNWGNLTLVNTTVSDNTVAGVASDADGGGINSWSGAAVTLNNSSVVDNHAVASVNGRYAEGGGIFMDDSTTLTMRSSNVSGNATVLTSTLPYSFDDGTGTQTIDMNSNSGGVHMGNDVTTTVDNTHIDHNSITVDDPYGEPIAFGAGICSCTTNQTTSVLTIRNSTVSDNSLDATVASQADVYPGSGDALELDSAGSIANTQVLGNTATDHALTGDAIVVAAGLETANVNTNAISISNTKISANTATAIAPNGQAVVVGAGVLNQGPTRMQNDQITDNTGTASGRSGQSELAQGGGIYNGEGWSPGGPLTLQNTSITGNVLTGDSGATLEGAGLYTAGFPATLTSSVIARNVPDDCSGC
jgi:hypothetical protein